MRCHKCNQDSLNVDNGHIICEICGLDIDISMNLEEDHFLDLFFYNKNLEEAEKLGHEAMIEGKELGDNPYSLTGDQLISHKRWELGYRHEKESYELNALSLSSEKIQNDLKNQIKQLEIQNKVLEDKISDFIPPSCKYIEYFCSNLLRRKIIGKILSKDVFSFLQKYKAFHMDTIGPWECPD